MKRSIYDVTITFLTGPLGSQPGRDVATEYIASKIAERVEAAGIPLPPKNGQGVAIDEDEARADELERATTVFYRTPEGAPAFMDYQLKGMLKGAAQVLNGKIVAGEKGAPLKNLKSKVNNLVFVRPRMIAVEMPAGGTIDFLERPLRAETAQGPRTALARSEVLPSGTVVRFQIHLLEGDITEKVLHELLAYGEYAGFGQWRNGGNGQFTYTLTPAE